MNAPSIATTNQIVRTVGSTTLIVDPDRREIYFGPTRCYLGDTVHLRCIQVLVENSGAPVPSNVILDRMGPSFIQSRDDVRIAIYRLKRKLRDNGMADLAKRIRNVRGAYALQ